jgi:hypothetical protein
MWVYVVVFICLVVVVAILGMVLHAKGVFSSERCSGCGGYLSIMRQHDEVCDSCGCHY